MSDRFQDLRDDALAIWYAGVDAVRPDRLIAEQLRIADGFISVGDEVIALNTIGQIAVVGAGKAGMGMAAAVETALGEKVLLEKRVDGVVSVPANCIQPLRHIRLRAGRPAGINEPTEAGVAAATEMLALVERLQPEDLCLCLISGGGSALLPAPAPGVALAEKQFLARELAARGADIRELNTVRKQLSRIKGGGLARACRAGRLITLIISDVLGDPLDIVASGPTVFDPGTPADALNVLTQFQLVDEPRIAGAVRFLRDRSVSSDVMLAPKCQGTNMVIGNNATAVDAAGQEAVRRGYQPALSSANEPEGPAEEIAAHLVAMARRMRNSAEPNCLISGGEPTVQLIRESERGLGGRNQQLVLAALNDMASMPGVVLLSGGTDGEDGPTDAAGAMADAALADAASQRGYQASDYLARNDAYHFFEPFGSLIKTGPTHTNVCDLRIVLVDKSRDRNVTTKRP